MSLPAFFAPGLRKTEYCELAALFFLQAMAVGMWTVPLSTVLQAHDLGALRPYAFATSGLAAFVSPLIFGAMADRHASPVRVLRWLAAASATTAALAAWSIDRAWSRFAVLGLIQLYSVSWVPTGSIINTIVFSRLRDSQRQFGPLRVLSTFGWMCGCWLVSAFRADDSPAAGYSSAAAWLSLVVLTWFLPQTDPPPSTGHTSWRERLGWDALALLKHHDHRVVFITTALASIPLAAFYAFTPPHLVQLGFHRTTAWMSLGQVTEVIATLSLAWLFARWRLKWIFAVGLGFGMLRFALCACNERAALLAGVTLHGCCFALFFLTGQIYLNERVEAAWRARAQALMWLMNGGVGNLVGYLATGWWFSQCTNPSGINWTVFWGVLAAAIGLVLAYFLLTYHGQGVGFARSKDAAKVLPPPSDAFGPARDN